MSKKSMILALSLALAMVWAMAGMGAAQEKKATAPKFHYIGAAKCKMCHNKEATGKQYDIWAASPHAKAFDALKGEKSLAFAKEKGIADPQKDPKCLKCHTTAAAAAGDTTVKAAEGVGCESCHGPGSEYKAMKTMQGLKAGTIKAETVGLVMPTEATCKTCHNPENPFHKEFVFAEMVKKIAHPIPKAPAAAK